MPDAKEISALLIAEQTTENDLLETSIPNAMTETGYVSRKITFGAFGAWIAKTLQFASDLRTTSKTIIGAINELAQGSGQSLDTLNDVDIDAQTLTDGQGIVYDATAQKWKNGTVSGGGGHAYSMTEHVVGTWVDGSPLYEITLEINTQVNLDNQNWTTIPWNNEPSNIDFLVSAEITRICPNTNHGLRFNSIDGHIKGAALVDSSFPPVPNLTEYVTIRYTKSST